MKMHIDYVLVVEGKSDVDFLSSFIDGEIVTTNGSSVPHETIDYLKNISQTKRIVVLTDPDSPGKSIRHLIESEIPGCLNAYVKKENCIKKGKVGVAESSKEEVLNALKNIKIIDDVCAIGTLTTFDLFTLGLIGNEESDSLRNYVSEQLHLGHNNGKELLRKLNQFNISYEDMEKIINGRK